MANPINFQALNMLAEQNNITYPIKFAVLADLHVKDTDFLAIKKVFKDIAEEQVHFAVACGDLTQCGTFEEVTKMHCIAAQWMDSTNIPLRA